MPIAITINGKQILAQRIIIEEHNVTIEPFQGVQVSGNMSMKYEDFCDFRDKMINWAEKSAEDTGAV